MKDVKLAKLDKSAESAQICSFQLKIYHAIFLISISNTFRQCKGFRHLSNFETWCFSL